jgi:hypothetical protein
VPTRSKKMATKIELPGFSVALSGQWASADPLPRRATAGGSFSKLRHSMTPGRWGALLASFVAAGAVVVLLLSLGWLTPRAASPSTRISPEAYERVASGMRREEVQAVIGLPPGDYRDGEHSPGGHSYTEWSEEAGAEEFGAGATAGRLQWEGNGHSIVAGFNEAGVVTWKTLWKHVPPTPRTPFDRVRAHLGL